jgi:hypothetical protein
MAGGVGSHDVVVRQQMLEPELLHRLGVGAHTRRIRADLGLGKHDAKLHVSMLLAAGRLTGRQIR